jgi:hypothetical protein
MKSVSHHDQSSPMPLCLNVTVGKSRGLARMASKRSRSGAILFGFLARCPSST